MKKIVVLGTCCLALLACSRMTEEEVSIYETQELVITAYGANTDVNTKTARINAAIKDFQKLYRDGYNPNEYVHEVLSAHNLSEDLLTEKEIRRINSAI